MTECGAKACIWVGITIVLILGVINRIGLYADGAGYLYQILTTGAGFVADQSRQFSDVLTQAPLLVALWFEVRSLSWLTFIHSAGLVLVPGTVWLLALFISRRSRGFWLFVAAFCVAWLMTGFMAIEEYNIAQALAALCLAILLKDKWVVWHLVALIIAAVALTHTYESNLFMAPLLIAVTLHRLFRHDGTDRVEKALLAAAVAIFGYAFAIAAMGVIWSEHPENRAAAADLQAVINPKVILFAVLCVLFGRACLSQKPALGWPLGLAVVLTICEIIGSALWANGPFSYYSVRVVAAVLLFFALAGATLLSLDFAAMRKFYDPPKLSAFVTLLFFGLAVPFAFNEVEFGWWLNKYQILAEAIEANTPVDKIPLHDTSTMQKYSWPWTNPQLSLLLRKDGTAMILNCTCYHGWQSFDPADVKGDPLERYR